MTSTLNYHSWHFLLDLREYEGGALEGGAMARTAGALDRLWDRGDGIMSGPCPSRGHQAECADAARIRER